MAPNQMIPFLGAEEGSFQCHSSKKPPQDSSIMADDIGWFNASCYNHGIMGYETPNMAGRRHHAVPGEKDTNWEGGWRVPLRDALARCDRTGRVFNDICSLQDFIPTFAAAVGEPDLVEKVKRAIRSATRPTRFISMA